MALMAVIFQEDFTVCGCHSFQIVGYTVFMLDFGLSVKNFPKPLVWKYSLMNILKCSEIKFMLQRPAFSQEIFKRWSILAFLYNVILHIAVVHFDVKIFTIV